MGTNKKASNRPVATHCKVKGCRGDVTKFAFCQEHFDQFKFGLITKNGAPAADYEKKVDHWQKYKERTA